jgi:TIR domain
MIEWDVFISHASEDKIDLVHPLAESLQKLGLRVWYDDFTLMIGDSLRQSIDSGLAKSRFGVVVITLRAVAADAPMCEFCCQLWVGDDGRFHIRES